MVSTVIHADDVAVNSINKTQSVKKQLIDSHENEPFPHHNNIFGEDENTKLPDSFKYFFYFIIAVSVVALLIILVKVYRLFRSSLKIPYKEVDDFCF